MPKKNLKNGGFIKITLIIVAVLVLLKYAYDLDVIDFLTRGKFKELLDKFYELGQKGWSEYKEIILKLISIIKEWAVKGWNAIKN